MHSGTCPGTHGDAALVPPDSLAPVQQLYFSLKTTTAELLASNRTEEDLARYIGADWLIYQELDDLISAVQFDGSDAQAFDTSCFSGEYVTGDVTSNYLEFIERKRNDAAKAKSLLS